MAAAHYRYPRASISLFVVLKRTLAVQIASHSGTATLDPFTVSLSVYWDLGFHLDAPAEDLHQFGFPTHPYQPSDSPAAKSFHLFFSVERNGPGPDNTFCETIPCARCLDDGGDALAIHSVQRTSEPSNASSQRRHLHNSLTHHVSRAARGVFVVHTAHLLQVGVRCPQAILK